MAVYVDKLRTYSPEWYSNVQAAWNGARHRHQWCHMWADSDDELDSFARKLRLKPEWAHRRRDGTKHYDLVPTKRSKAVSLGAVEREL